MKNILKQLVDLQARVHALEAQVKFYKTEMSLQAQYQSATSASAPSDSGEREAVSTGEGASNVDHLENSAEGHNGTVKPGSIVACAKMSVRSQLRCEHHRLASSCRLCREQKEAAPVAVAGSQSAASVAAFSGSESVIPFDPAPASTSGVVVKTEQQTSGSKASDMPQSPPAPPQTDLHNLKWYENRKCWRLKWFRKGFYHEEYFRAIPKVKRGKTPEEAKAEALREAMAVRRKKFIGRKPKRTLIYKKKNGSKRNKGKTKKNATRRAISKKKK
mmetsp:Transcript_117213/g.190719  ORF Transcript_117213/g.190719 Transcript_117213/m.190719 type:complete len:274 (-) Transcript_117213:200-1021(-)